ncbi:MAG: NAD(P)H-dependent oxidoreductase [Spirochaetes bacterium]|nr:NAD(P)H-dependent oxidoreductase [Spirochaetota bacterium]
MTIAALNGSPRGMQSNSNEILELLRQLDGAGLQWITVSTIRELRNAGTAQSSASRLPEIPADLLSANCLLLVFPLYVDSLPASFMRYLDAYAAARAAAGVTAAQRVFVVSNCGFYEGEQNACALRICQNFCIANGLDWCGGIGFGTGEMIRGLRAVPPQAAIRQPLFAALEELHGAITDPVGRLSKNIFTQHKFPWILYKLMGEAGWRRQAKTNGLKAASLAAQPY